VPEVVLALQRELEAQVFCLELLEAQGLLHDETQLVVVERLEHVVGGAHAHRFDGALGRAVRGHDDDGDVLLEHRSARLQPLEELDAVVAGQVEIRQHEPRPLRFRGRDGLLRRRDGAHFVPLLSQEDREELAHRELVVDDHDRLTGHGDGPRRWGS
jgi:hypothetical protein